VSSEFAELALELAYAVCGGGVEEAVCDGGAGGWGGGWRESVWDVRV